MALSQQSLGVLRDQINVAQTETHKAMKNGAPVEVTNALLALTTAVKQIAREGGLNIV